MSAPFNYFNYFTEIEEHFWHRRGAHILVSPLDWAIVETWQKAGIPLQVVLRGIDRAFESYQRSRRGAAGRPLKSLAYCMDAVLEAAADAQEAAAGTGPESGVPRGAPSEQREAPAGSPAKEPFSRDELRTFFVRNAERLTRAATRLEESAPPLALPARETRRKLEEAAMLLDSAAALDLEDLERRLTVLEEKLLAALTAGSSEDLLLKLRRELDRQLAPYRRKMKPEQLSVLERQYLQKRLFEEYDLPRLSLFYLT